ncbi:MAG: hypothetical protein A2792_00270 [Sphingomonadales bacterium RIFCSPHIGHO2_01_FULL_65_20]|nr:MAG: hypothetical protein A2792_00270 [Sphingomonadales bacterium RIFCSPHIGHO2_01_FULL_65_20]
MSQKRSSAVTQQRIKQRSPLAVSTNTGSVDAAECGPLFTEMHFPLDVALFTRPQSQALRPVLQSYNSLNPAGVILIHIGHVLLRFFGRTITPLEILNHLLTGWSAVLAIRPAKKQAGRTLDGVTHDALPWRRAA